MSHTPGPWKLGEFKQHGGYDGITSAVSAGRAVFDGKHYGQGYCQDIEPEAKARMIADARLTSAAPDLLEALEAAKAELEAYEQELNGESYNDPRINAAIAKARGQ